jgi:hypothetical protein
VIHASSPHHKRSLGLPPAARIAVGVIVLSVLVATVGLANSRLTEAAPGPQLRVEAPAHVAVGEPIQIAVVVQNANGIAAYELTAQFNTSIAHLSGLQQRQNDLKKLGRSVETLGPIDLADGVTFGAYSCPFSSCPNTNGKVKNTQGGKGTLKLGTFSIVVDQAGSFVIQLSTLKFTDPDGNPVNVNLGNTTIAVQVQ